MNDLLLLHPEPERARALQDELERAGDLRVIGNVRRVATARWCAGTQGVAVVAAAPQLADGSAVSLLHALQALPAERPRPKLLLLAQSADDALLVEALRAGADGYWIDGDPSRTLAQAVHETLRDEAVMAPSLARQVVGYFSARGPRLAPLKLSDADRELLMRLERGQAPSDIARGELQTDVAEVRRHIRRIYRKMQWDLRAAMLGLNPG